MNWKVTNIADFKPTISIIALYINDLNKPMKRQRMSMWIKKIVSELKKKPTLNINI